VTKTELDALILENELIKRYKPRYNIRLKDDKTYPYIKVNWQEDFPRVLVVRRMLKDGNRYFGPYTSSRACYQTLDALRRVFPYLDCDREITGKDARPCLYFHIKLCGGPCIGAQSREEYRETVRQLMQFLEGDTVQVLRQLRSADGARGGQPPVRAGRALSRPAARPRSASPSSRRSSAPARKTPTTWRWPRMAAAAMPPCRSSWCAAAG
jgi:excinuclease UvrABC nuclease subunit